MRRIIPYTIPIAITSLFVLTAHSVFIWIAIFIILCISLMKKRIGKFDNSQIISEYKFFHYDVSMSWLKTISGIFFVIFNFWILWFLYHFEIPIWSLIIFIYSCIIINRNFAISLAHDLMHSTRRMDRGPFF